MPSFDKSYFVFPLEKAAGFKNKPTLTPSMGDDVIEAVLVVLLGLTQVLGFTF